MQTFLPYPDFARSAAVLDSPRLGKQRVEALQVLRSLELPDYGWSNHPAVRMWRGCTPALVSYGLACVEAWLGRGHADGTARLIGEFAPEVVGVPQAELAAAGLMPDWLGDEAVHRSHRSALLHKEPSTYRPVFGDDEPDDLPYAWPEPREASSAEPPRGRRLWVVRPGGAEALHSFLTEGVVGLPTDSGIDVDVVAGLEELRRLADGAEGEAAAAAPQADLRTLLARTSPGQRPGKQLRQLAALVHDVEIGDEVGLPIEGERTLLLGEVVGDYAFAPRRGAAVPHRRAVRWGGRLARSAVLPPTRLQDPRLLFRVDVAP